MGYVDDETYNQLQDKYQQAVAALKFYASYNSWQAFGYSDEFETIIKDGQKCKDRDHDIIGGRKARETLRELGELD